MTIYLRRSAALAAVAALFLALPGCIFSPDGGGEEKPPPPVTYTWPDTEELLMDNFKAAYGSMDLDAYIGKTGDDPVEPVLYNDGADDAYKFRFSPQDVTELGLATDFLGYDEEVSVATRMFRGAVGAGGQTITSIDFNRLDLKTSWVTIGPENQYFPNSKMRDYEVEIIFYYTNTDGDAASFTVRSLQRFYVKSKLIEQGDGTAKLRWYLYGQEDLGPL